MRPLRLIAVVSLGTLACSQVTKPQGKVVTLGAVVDRTGSQAWSGWVESIALAEAHTNAALKAAGYKDLQFKIAVSDSANDPELSVARATDLVRAQGAKALLTDSSQNDIAINKLNYVADPLGVPIQCSACTSGSINNPTATGIDATETDALRDAQHWNFRGTMPTKLISSLAVRLLRERPHSGDVNQDGRFKVAIYASNESFGKSTAADVSAKVLALPDGGADPTSAVEVIFHPSDADPNRYDWYGDLTKLSDSATDFPDGGSVGDGYPDAIVVASFPQLHAAIVASHKAGGYTVPLLHFHNMRNQAAIQSLGDRADDQEGLAHLALDNGASGELFAADLLAKTGTPAAFRDSTFYDNAVTLMLATIAATKGLDDPLTVTPTQIRDALKATSTSGGEQIRTGSAEIQKAINFIKAGTPINYEGASGPMDYDANQSVKTRIGHFKIKGMVASDLEKYDCVASNDCPVY